MEKITINELIDFRQKSTPSHKKHFAQKLKTRKAKIKENEKKSNGGNYWVTSISCIHKVYKSMNKELYDLKIEELNQRYKDTSLRNKKTLERNIEILMNFKDFDFTDLRPTKDLAFEKILRDYKIVNVTEFPLYINPNFVFSFKENDIIEIGAVWFIAKLDGFKKSELGMFCEALYRFLLKNYSTNYKISHQYCIAIDICNTQKTSYSDLINGDIPFLIENTLKEIKEL